ncbi:alpha/beta fold hydrolase [Streptomyces yaanensis]|uniref:Alpha/beta fold hydrolase n=1 Tax=Streptomyces yaanensis TaxID=1142239 RepID=A0ABV7S524_9ACTN|nr:alpha/beta hydrolase [Streptomyces sp. CGMCC 4.7035]WNB99649.1 alpha/beta hydrolase [Streptomyces sp. CGMCC 4.7035]
MTHTSETQTFATEDRRLAYRDEGAGPPLVLLHGGFLDHHMWDDQTPVFARTHRVIALDARGHGASSNATRPFRHTDDLAAILRHLRLGPAVLVGLSMGGAIAVDTALEHPDLVRALVVSGVGTSEPDFRDPWTTAVSSSYWHALGAGDIDAFLDAFSQFTYGPERTAEDVDPEVERRVREMARGTIGKHTRDEPDWSVPVTDTWARAAKIEVPVLAVNGGIDSVDHIGMAERLVRTVGNGRTTVVEGTAHYPNMERPDAFNAIVGDFLRSLHS